MQLEGPRPAFQKKPRKVKVCFIKFYYMQLWSSCLYKNGAVQINTSYVDVWLKTYLFQVSYGSTYLVLFECIPLCGFKAIEYMYQLHSSIFLTCSVKYLKIAILLLADIMMISYISHNKSFTTYLLWFAFYKDNETYSYTTVYFYNAKY